MKIFFAFVALFLVVACRPVHVTKQYYDEYVNPKPSIDYEDTVSADIPAEFLDDYYTIDSKIVRLVDQIDLMDSRLDEAWISLQKTSNPWIKRLAVLDEHQLFVSGDDSLGYDPLARDVAAGLEEKAKRVVVYKDERIFLAHVASKGSDPLRTTLVELDIEALTAEIPNSRTLLAASGHVFGPSSGLPSEALVKLESSTNYSGSMRVDGRAWYWIRSMASNNLVYLYAPRG
jgi:hypothetical protein